MLAAQQCGHNDVMRMMSTVNEDNDVDNKLFYQSMVDDDGNGAKNGGGVV